MYSREIRGYIPVTMYKPDESNKEDFKVKKYERIQKQLNCTKTICNGNCKGCGK